MLTSHATFVLSTQPPKQEFIDRVRKRNATKTQREAGGDEKEESHTKKKERQEEKKEWPVIEGKDKPSEIDPSSRKVRNESGLAGGAESSKRGDDEATTDVHEKRHPKKKDERNSRRPNRARSNEESRTHRPTKVAGKGERHPDSQQQQRQTNA